MRRGGRERQRRRARWGDGEVGRRPMSRCARMRIRSVGRRRGIIRAGMGRSGGMDWIMGCRACIDCSLIRVQRERCTSMNVRLCSARTATVVSSSMLSESIHPVPIHPISTVRGPHAPSPSLRPKPRHIHRSTSKPTHTAVSSPRPHPPYIHPARTAACVHHRGEICCARRRR